MSTFDQFLKTKGIENFSKYVSQSLPEQLAQRICGGTGTESMQTAAEAWKCLAKTLLELAAAYNRLTVQQWLGISAKKAKKNIEGYAQWVYTTAAAAHSLGWQITQAADVYETTCRTLVPAAVVSEKRVLLENLEKNNTFGQNNIAINLAEETYQNMKIENASTIIGYKFDAENYSNFPGFSEALTIVAKNGINGKNALPTKIMING